MIRLSNRCNISRDDLILSILSPLGAGLLLVLVTTTGGFSGSEYVITSLFFSVSLVSPGWLLVAAPLFLLLSCAFPHDARRGTAVATSSVIFVAAAMLSWQIWVASYDRFLLASPAWWFLCCAPYLCLVLTLSVLMLGGRASPMIKRRVSIWLLSALLTDYVFLSWSAAGSGWRFRYLLWS